MQSWRGLATCGEPHWQNSTLCKSRVPGERGWPFLQQQGAWRWQKNRQALFLELSSQELGSRHRVMVATQKG